MYLMAVSTMTRACQPFDRVWYTVRGFIALLLLICLLIYVYSDNRPGINFKVSVPVPLSSRHSKVIKNENLFGSLKNDSVVIVVQVHNRSIYLQHLIKSLQKSANISQTLLIFSHDYYDDKVNKLVRQIDFCKVLQIFYPYSLQKYEHEFPGQDPNDCPPDIPAKDALKRNCGNAFHPDHYGHYRNANNVQAKHHWWWKLNQVFDYLDVTQYFTGQVLFLEEDHYVSQDFLYVLKLMQNQATKLCPACKIFTVGNHLEPKVYGITKPDHVNVSPWQHNMGFAFNRSVWREIRNCARTFCEYDDYNWDFTFRFVSQQCASRVFLTMAVERTRIFHIGECGMHIKKSNCDPTPAISKIRLLHRDALKSHQMYPKSLVLSWYAADDGAIIMNGGWGDPRDHKLCLSFVRNPSTENATITKDENQIG